MDKLIKRRLSTSTKSKQKQLAKQQAHLLDEVGLITHILEEATKEQLPQKIANEAAQIALKFTGNTSARPIWKGGGMPS